MAFTTLPTYSTGDSVTAANWNAYVKNNFAAMPPDVFTATGEIFVGEGADTGGLLSPEIIGKSLVVATGQTLGVKYSGTSTSIYTFAQYTNADYLGATFGGTTVLISISDATGYNVPATAVMLIARLDVIWNAGSINDYVSITNTSDTDMEMLRIDYNQFDIGVAMSRSGLVVPANGNLILEITDSSDVTLDLQFTGYLTS